MVATSTTGNRHSAKPKKHSANDLPSVTLGKEHTTSTVPANSSFAECFLSGTRQRLCRELKTTLGKKSTWRSGNGHGAFAECQILGTRQSLPFCRVSKFRPSANLACLSYVKVWTLDKDWFLPCVKEGALGKVAPFVVCQSMGTRQRPFQIHRIWLLCRVSKFRHSTKMPF